MNWKSGILLPQNAVMRATFNQNSNGRFTDEQTVVRILVTRQGTVSWRIRIT